MSPLYGLVPLTDTAKNPIPTPKMIILTFSVYPFTILPFFSLMHKDLVLSIKNEQYSIKKTILGRVWPSLPIEGWNALKCDLGRNLSFDVLHHPVFSTLELLLFSTLDSSFQL